MHVQTASLVQFQFYRKQEFYRFFALITLLHFEYSTKKATMSPILSHLSKHRCIYYCLMLFLWLQSIKMCLISIK